MMEVNETSTIRAFNANTTANIMSDLVVTDMGNDTRQITETEDGGIVWWKIIVFGFLALFILISNGLVILCVVR